MSHTTAIHTAATSPIELVPSNYPWITTDPLSINACEVEMPGGEAFAYGSLVGLNGQLSKFADALSQTESDTLQDRIFTSVPNLSRGLPSANTSRIEQSAHIGASLFVATRHFTQHPFTIFAIESATPDDERTKVIKIAAGLPKSYPKCLKILGITPMMTGRRSRG